MLDPEIGDFVDIVNATYSQMPPMEDLTVQQIRDMSAKARQRWSQGGPGMERTRELDAGLDGLPARLRIHFPYGAPTIAPALIYLHGGGWSLFSIDTHDRVMREYAARAGIVVIGVDYSLAPEARFPKAVYEIAAAVNWLVQNAKCLGIDASRLIIGGDSAGANLSVAASLALRDAGHPYALIGMLLNYGVFDASFERPSYRAYGDFFLTRKDMEWFWNNYVRSEADYDDPFASVIRADLAGLPPTFMVIAECDVLRDENLEMAKRFRLADVAVEATVYPGTVHSFLEAVSIAKVSNQAFADTAKWLMRLCSENDVSSIQVRRLPALALRSD